LTKLPNSEVGKFCLIHKCSSEYIFSVYYFSRVLSVKNDLRLIFTNRKTFSFKMCTYRNVWNIITWNFNFFWVWRYKIAVVRQSRLHQYKHILFLASLFTVSVSASDSWLVWLQYKRLSFSRLMAGLLDARHRFWPEENMHALAAVQTNRTDLVTATGSIKYLHRFNRRSINIIIYNKNNHNNNHNIIILSTDRPTGRPTDCCAVFETVWEINLTAKWCVCLFEQCK